MQITIGFEKTETKRYTDLQSKSLAAPLPIVQLKNEETFFFKHSIIFC
jgi:hypothetical protein